METVVSGLGALKHGEASGSLGGASSSSSFPKHHESELLVDSQKSRQLTGEASSLGGSICAAARCVMCASALANETLWRRPWELVMMQSCARSKAGGIGCEGEQSATGPGSAECGPLVPSTLGAIERGRGTRGRPSLFDPTILTTDLCGTFCAVRHALWHAAAREVCEWSIPAHQERRQALDEYFLFSCLSQVGRAASSTGVGERRGMLGLTVATPNYDCLRYWQHFSVCAVQYIQQPPQALAARAAAMMTSRNGPAEQLRAVCPSQVRCICKANRRPIAATSTVANA